MIKKTITLFVIFFLFGNITQGQDLDDFMVLPTIEKPIFAIVFTPTALFHPRIPATQLGVEFNLGNHFTIVQEGGFIHQNQDKIINQTGYRIRSEFRFFLFNYEIEETNFFIGIQYRNWKFKYDTSDTFCRFDCLYQQRLDYTVEQKAQGVNFTLGFHYPFQNGIQVEWGGAFGRVTRENTPQKLPDDVELIAQSVNIFSRPNGEAYKVTHIALLFWVKIGYAF